MILDRTSRAGLISVAICAVAGCAEKPDLHTQAMRDAKIRDEIIGTDTGASKLQQLRQENDERVNAPLRAFYTEKPPKCDSQNARKASSEATAALLVWPSSGAPAFDGIRVGTNALNVADALKGHRCKDASRKLYDLVLSTYPGQGYAGLRDRAKVGIDDLR